MRDEMMGAVVRRAIEHPEFRKRLMEDPQAALDDHGFVLDSSEMEAIEKLQQDLGGDDAEQKLLELAGRFGITPQQN
jgi:hypothetical protein